MKCCPLLFSLLVVAAGHFASAQNPGSKMDGILGIPFGADQDTAKKTVVSRTHGHFNRPKSQDNLLCFDGGHFAGFKVVYLNLEFTKEKFSRIQIRLEASSKDHQKETGALKQMLTEKYGAPRKDDPGRMLWVFDIPGQDPNLIELLPDPPGVGVLINYQSESIKNSNDNKPAPPVPGSLKPTPTNPSAKDDL